MTMQILIKNTFISLHSEMNNPSAKMITGGRVRSRTEPCDNDNNNGILGGVGVCTLTQAYTDTDDNINMNCNSSVISPIVQSPLSSSSNSFLFNFESGCNTNSNGMRSYMAGEERFCLWETTLSSSDTCFDCERFNTANSHDNNNGESEVEGAEKKFRDNLPSGITSTSEKTGDDMKQPSSPSSRSSLNSLSTSLIGQLNVNEHECNNNNNNMVFNNNKNNLAGKQMENKNFSKNEQNKKSSLKNTNKSFLSNVSSCISSTAAGIEASFSKNSEILNNNIITNVTKSLENVVSLSSTEDGERLNSRMASSSFQNISCIEDISVSSSAGSPLLTHRSEFIKNKNVSNTMLYYSSVIKEDPTLTVSSSVERLNGSNDNMTTVMLRNIPNKYTQRMLIDVVNEYFKGLYDFFYLPIDFRNKCNVGYAFVNFLHPYYAELFHKKFHGYKLTAFKSNKVCAVTWGRVQGLKANIEHYRNSAVMSIPIPQYKPMLFQNGIMIPWPDSDGPLPIVKLRPVKL